MFKKNIRGYQRPENKGRCYTCRICTFKRFYKDKYAWLWVNNKFNKIEFKSIWKMMKHL